jgi:hypothetical protein
LCGLAEVGVFVIYVCWCVFSVCPPFGLYVISVCLFICVRLCDSMVSSTTSSQVPHLPASALFCFVLFLSFVVDSPPPCCSYSLLPRGGTGLALSTLHLSMPDQDDHPCVSDEPSSFGQRE